MKLRNSILSLVLMVMLLVCPITNGFASGFDTFPLNAWYFVGSFSFTNYNITPVKTVEGRYLTIAVDFYKPTWDAGLGEVKLTMDVWDAYTGASITGQFVVGITSGTTIISVPIYNLDMGYAGRQVQIWFDASSAGASNGNYRSLTIDYYRVYTSNSTI